jgi:hypothetical protein
MLSTTQNDNDSTATLIITEALSSETEYPVFLYGQVPHDPSLHKRENF